jgi:hypothetical protein
VPEVHDLAAPGDDREIAGQPTVVDVALETAVDPRQPDGVEAVGPRARQ